jgi:hypothetical protein
MWSAASGAFELVLRACLRNETNGMIGTHVALYFTDANQSMQIKNELFNRNNYLGRDKSSFFIDILNAESDTISYLQDSNSWYNRWKHGRRIELYEVLDVDDAQIERAHYAMLALLAENRVYDWTMNLNSLFPGCELPISCLCCCCQCWSWVDCKCCLLRGITCVSAVLVGLAATRGAGEQRAAEVLGLKPRAVLGGWLPADIISELIEAGVLRQNPMFLEANSVSQLIMQR